MFLFCHTKYDLSLLYADMMLSWHHPRDTPIPGPSFTSRPRQTCMQRANRVLTNSTVLLWRNWWPEME